MSNLPLHCLRSAAAFIHPLCVAAVGLTLAWTPESHSASLYGQLTNAQTGQPIADAEIQALNAFNDLLPVRSVRTDPGGRYFIDNLPAGAYLVRAAPPGHLLRLASAQNTIDCSHAETVRSCAQRLDAPGSALHPRELWLADIGSRQLDLQSTPAARLQGQVGLTDTGRSPQISVQVGASNEPAIFPVDPHTGEFVVDHISPGIYTVGVCTSGAICRDASGAEFDALGSDAARLPLQLEAGRTHTLPDLSLRPGAAITLDAPFALPIYMDLQNLPRITVSREGEPALDIALAQAPPALQNLRPGRFRLLFGTLDDVRWHARWHDGTDCTRARCDASSVTPIVLGAGETRDGVTVALQSRQRISGQILQPGTGQPIPGMYVSVLHWEMFGGNASGLYLETLVHTDAEGRYVIEGLAPQSYVLIVSNARAPAPWLSERWPGVRCSALDLDACLPLNQNQFVLQQDQQAGGVDFTPELGGTISGQFTGIAPDIHTFAELRHADSGQDFPVNFEAVTGDRSWRSDPLPTGDYIATGVAVAADFQSSRRQVFPLLDCPAEAGACTPASAGRIAVSAGRDAGGVDFHFSHAPAPARQKSTAATAGSLPGKAQTCLSLLPNDHALGCRMLLRAD